MSSKISALVNKSELDPNDSFVLVDSVALDNKKTTVSSMEKRDFLPDQVIDLTRCISPFPLLSNGNSPSSAITLAERNFLVFPVYIPKQTTITSFSIRASSTGSVSFDAEYGFYSHEQGLPTNKIASESFTIPALGNSEFNEQVFTTPIILKRGIYWVAILNKSAVTASLSSASSSSNIFGNLVGTSQDITGSDPRCFSSVVPLADNFLPSSLVSRSVDMRVTTASQTTLRLRVSVAIAYLRYV